MSQSPAALELRSISLHEANRFVAKLQRSCRPVLNHKFAIAVQDNKGVLRGVAIAGRPTLPELDTGYRLEILSVATDGTPKASTVLYAAAARAGATIGYRLADILTLARDADTGTSLRAAGWVRVAVTRGGPRGDIPGSTGTSPWAGPTRWHAAPPAVSATIRRTA